MRRIAAIFLILMLAGCVTVKVPKYLQDEFPYRQSFAANFDQTFTATLKALKETGWRVSETTSPAMMAPRDVSDKEKRYQVMIFTELKQSPLFLASSYESLNVLVSSADATHADVEIRYLMMTALPFKTVNSFQNDRLVKKIFKKIATQLKK